MNSELFCLPQKRLMKRIEIEKRAAGNISGVFVDVFNKIKGASENDGWKPVSLFFRDTSEENRHKNRLDTSDGYSLSYYLRSHPSIISKLSSGKGKPFMFKWVPEEVKKTMTVTEATFFKNIPPGIIQKIKDNSLENFDVLRATEFFMSRKDCGQWIKYPATFFSEQSGIPIENFLYACNCLMTMELLVVAHVKNQKLLPSLMLKFTPTNESLNNALSGEEINALRIFGKNDANTSGFSFAVRKYFFDFIEHYPENSKPEKISSEEKIESPKEKNLEVTGKNTEEVIEPSNLFEKPQQQQATDYSSELNEIKADIEKLQDNAVNPTLLKILDEIKTGFLSFGKISESIYEADTRRMELLNGVLKLNEQQKQENADMKQQMIAMKKLLNKTDRDKLELLKRIQNKLNMMMGQIISETDRFARIPRHQLDDHRIEGHKSDIIRIAVQTEDDIKKILLNS